MVAFIKIKIFRQALIKGQITAKVKNDDNKSHLENNIYFNET